MESFDGLSLTLVESISKLFHINEGEASIMQLLGLLTVEAK